MRGEKGFTFVEVLVIVVLIAIISLVAVPSYKKGLETSKNNQAKGRLVEVANAARLYNEDARGADQVAGKFGTPVSGYRDPSVLFYFTPDGTEAEAHKAYAYLKDPESFSGTSFRGYDYYICTPDKADATCGGDINVIAIMTPGQNITDTRYVGKVWKISNQNPGKVVMSSAS